MIFAPEILIAKMYLDMLNRSYKSNDTLHWSWPFIMCHRLDYGASSILYALLFYTQRWAHAFLNVKYRRGTVLYSKNTPFTLPLLHILKTFHLFIFEVFLYSASYDTTSQTQGMWGPMDNLKGLCLIALCVGFRQLKQRIEQAHICNFSKSMYWTCISELHDWC